MFRLEKKIGIYSKKKW